MIVLQFCGFNSLVAKAIERFTDPTGTGIGHASAVLPTGELLDAQHEDGLGGRPAGVQIRPANYGESCGMINRLRVELPTSDDVTSKFYGFLTAQIGKPYDTAAIEEFVTSRQWRDTGAWFCSELQAAGLEDCHFFIPLWVPDNKMTPAMLCAICSAFAPVVPYNG